jgi:hypothetical protein
VLVESHVFRQFGLEVAGQSFLVYPGQSLP